MNILKKLAIGLVALIIALIALAYVLPGRQSTQRERVMAAPPEKVWPLVSQPKQWPRWAIWNQRDPNMKITYEGPESGVGAKWSWESTSEGNGSMTFDAAQENRELKYTLTFTDMGAASQGRIGLEPSGTGTKVTWSFETELGNNPMMRWFGLMLPEMVGRDFDAGLENLDKASR